MAAESNPVTVPAATTAPALSLHNELQSSFTGDTLSTLEQLGVTAYSTQEVESQVIEQALKQEAEHRDKQAATKRRLSTPSANDSQSAKRKKIPRKELPPLLSQSQSLSSPLPVPHHRVVHEDDPISAAGSLATKRLEQALRLRSEDDEKSQSLLAAARRAANKSRADGSSVIPVADKDARANVRQRMIDSGEVTPFHSMQGVEKHYRRVASQQRADSEEFGSKPKPAQVRTESMSSRSRSPSLSPSPAAAPVPVEPKAVKSRRFTTIQATKSSNDNPHPVSPPSSRSSLPALSESELPVRLTRAQLRAQIASIDKAVKHADRAANLVKEEPDENAMVDNDSDKETRVKTEASDDEWHGDLESSDEDAEEDVPSDDDDDVDEEFRTRSHRRARTARQLPRARTRTNNCSRRVPREAAEEDEVIEEQESLLDDDDDDNDDVGDSDNAFSDRSRPQRGRTVIVDDFLDYEFEDRLVACRNSRMFSSKVAHVEGRRDDDSSDSGDIVFDGGYVCPGRIWDRLFAYQQTSIKWLWELHCQNAGGIVADEMGLGKTIQMVSFLAGLHYSQQLESNQSNKYLTGIPPHLVLVPATIIAQWLREFHLWYPELRVLVLHDSVQIHHGQSKESVIEKLFAHCHVLITTYECARLYQHLLLGREWGYVVLDEGHKIRNPDAAITLTCKQFLSLHRVVLTGAPIQNSLIELWSIFDFIFPGKLGTLPVFEDEFCFPIMQGGFSNASTVQVNLAYRCAALLREMINPYILRRTKTDVAQHLPKKIEQVLFINLAPTQRDVYKEFLQSEDVLAVLDNRGSLFKAIHLLRKICNHPDLVGLTGLSGQSQSKVLKRVIDPRCDPDYGNIERSGKLQVLKQILGLWHREGHRVLVFAQTRQMLDIIESFIQSENYQYCRIDGLTTIKSRLPLIDEFNHNRSIYCFLLTTKAGGLGVNLTGADRVILYDPDWNPSTDLQARERSWRIGQTKSVTVYRLITRGTIEEKIYHRQIYKQFLTNKILNDPKQKRFFTRKDMKDLFSFDERQGENETARVFRAVAHSIDRAHTHSDDAGASTVTSPSADAKRKEKEEDELNDEPLSFDSLNIKSAPYNPVPAVDGGSDSEPKQGSENRILSLLFSSGGVQSAMNHDSIMEGATLNDRALADNIAKRVAEKAVAALRKSRADMRNQPLSVPTWTGRSGGYQTQLQSQSSQPQQPRKRFGTVSKSAINNNSSNDSSSVSDNQLFDASVSGMKKSSASQLTSSTLLAKLKSHSDRGLVTSASGLPSARAMTDSVEDREASSALTLHLSSLLSDLHAFLSSQSNGATTSRIINTFASRLRSEQEKLVFRQLLRQIAALRKGREGAEGKWRLKD